MRLSRDDVVIIDRAAEQRGLSRAEFIRDAALQAAQMVLMKQNLVRMSAGGFRVFTAALSGPPKVVPELVEVLKRRAPWKRA